MSKARRVEYQRNRWVWVRLFAHMEKAKDPSLALKELGVKPELSEDVNERADELIRWVDQWIKGNWHRHGSGYYAEVRHEFVAVLRDNPNVWNFDSQDRLNPILHAFIRSDSALPESLRDWFDHELEHLYCSSPPSLG